jgi:hypothetical protein
MIVWVRDRDRAEEGTKSAGRDDESSPDWAQQRRGQ